MDKIKKSKENYESIQSKIERSKEQKVRFEEDSELQSSHDDDESQDEYESDEEGEMDMEEGESEDEEGEEESSD